MININKLSIQIKDNLGKKPLCNGKPERAPHIKGFCFPLCWRCLSISLSVLTSSVFISFYKKYLSQHCIIISISSIILILPCLIDGFRQYFLNKESRNCRRIFTGVLAGIGLAALSAIMYINVE